MQNAQMNDWKIIKTKYKPPTLLTPRNMDLTSVHKQNQFYNALAQSSSERLFYSVVQTLKKPFHMKNIKHRIVAEKLVNIVNDNKNKRDSEIYTIIHHFLNKHYYKYVGFPNNENDERAQYRGKDIENMLMSLCMYNTNIIPTMKWDYYLDIGCSEGGITHVVGELLGISPDNTYGIDILPIEKVKHSDSFKYIQMEEESPLPCKLPFKDASICVITLIMSLHHIKNVNEYIKEIGRILKPGGILIIKEHDVDAKTDSDGKIILDILHGLYCMSWSKTGCQENPDFCDNYYANYQSKEQWTIQIESLAGCIRSSNKELDKYYSMAGNVERQFKSNKKIGNPHYVYWAMYVKQ